MEEEVTIYCDFCGSMECHGECRKYDFCEHCGSVGCKGECQKCPQCGKGRCNCPEELPGASLARKARQNQEALQRQMSRAIEERVYPSRKPLPDCSADEFAETLSKKKPKMGVAIRRNGLQYRKKV